MPHPASCFRQAIHLLLILLALAPLRAAPSEIVFCAYNIRNYVDASPAREGQSYGTKEKPEAEIAALVRIIKTINPDVLGIAEMGTSARLDHFKRRLAAAGLEYPHSEHVAGPDPDRHLALVSRHPIVARDSRAQVPFTLGEREDHVKRGFLDVTIEITPSYRLRCVGVHLKSKLPTPEGEALVRRHEAQQLRKHLDAILAADPETNLICYGDFNDTKNEPAIQEVMGPRGSAGYMADLWARDPLGDRWTYYWKTADLYSRIDFLFVSPGLFPEVVKTKSRVFRSADWDQASDHRPVYTSIIPVDKKRRP